MKKLLPSLLLFPMLAFGQKTYWTLIQQVPVPLNLSDTFILGIMNPPFTNELMTAQNVLNWTGVGPSNFSLTIGAQATNNDTVTSNALALTISAGTNTVLVQATNQINIVSNILALMLNAGTNTIMVQCSNQVNIVSNILAGLISGSGGGGNVLYGSNTVFGVSSGNTTNTILVGTNATLIVGTNSNSGSNVFAVYVPGLQPVPALAVDGPNDNVWIGQQLFVSGGFNALGVSAFTGTITANGAAEFKKGLQIDQGTSITNINNNYVITFTNTSGAGPSFLFPAGSVAITDVGIWTNAATGNHWGPLSIPASVPSAGAILTNAGAQWTTNSIIFTNLGSGLSVQIGTNGAVSVNGGAIPLSTIVTNAGTQWTTNVLIFTNIASSLGIQIGTNGHLLFDTHDGTSLGIGSPTVVTNSGSLLASGSLVTLDAHANCVSGTITLFDAGTSTTPNFPLVSLRFPSPSPYTSYIHVTISDATTNVLSNAGWSVGTNGIGGFAIIARASIGATNNFIWNYHIDGQ